MLYVFIRIAFSRRFYTQHAITVWKIENIFPKLSLFASWTGTMINPKWLEQPMSRTIVCGSKDVRVIVCLFITC